MNKITHSLVLLLIPFFGFGANVTYYGAAGQVSGSLALLEVNGFRCLIDVGSHYGEHPDGGKQETSLVAPTGERKFEFFPASIDAVILTHAHLDHTGRLPELFREGFKGPVYATFPTKKILEVMLEMEICYESNRIRDWEWSVGYRKKGNDYFKAHWHSECRWRKRISAHNKRKLEGSLYDLQKLHKSSRIDISPCQACAKVELSPILSRFREVSFDSVTKLTEGVSFQFIDAKHIPGSSSVLLQIKTSGSEAVDVLFSGDLGSDMSRFLSEPDPAPKADYVFVEGTYGDYSRGFSIEEEYQRFTKEIGSTIRDGGIVWIPAFALDRSQRILYELESAISQGKIQGVSNIYLPSPTAIKITELYINNPTWHDADVSTSLKKTYSSAVKEYLDLENFEPKPKSIIITTSGMMDSAYSVGLIPHLLQRTDLLIAFVGYQSPFTYGGQLKGGADSVVIDEAEVIKRAEISNFSCFSGHGDADDIDRWLSQNAESKIFLIHGEKGSLERRSEDLNRKGFSRVLKKGGCSFG